MTFCGEPSFFAHGVQHRLGEGRLHTYPQGMILMALVTQIYVEKAARFPQASGCAAPHLHNEQVAFTLHGLIFSACY